MLGAVQKSALAARQALERTGEAAAGCQGATDSALSQQGAALTAFQNSFAASMAQDQVSQCADPCAACLCVEVMAIFLLSLAFE